MKKMVLLASGILLVSCLIPCLVLADFSNPSQSPPETQPSVRVLSLNVMQNASEARSSRFQRIVNFLTSTPVHLMTLQELSCGPLDTPPTQDSGADLANMLAAAGLQYGYYTEVSWGHPDYLAFKVGILPRYPMLSTNAASTGTPTDIPPIPGLKNVVMAAVEIPGFGRIHLYSVHVYTPSAEGLETQIDNLIQFVNLVDDQHSHVASVVAGDMNFSVDSSPIAYQKFIDQGFLDAYAAAQGAADPRTCCTPASTSGCTYGVPGNPFTSPTSPSRIDFIFIRGNGVRVKASKVAFNGTEADFVSDHCAVLTEIIKPSIVPPTLLLLEN
jgi:endonuclease/exonuclease/phosphatase family metal-dependent hydrolase